MYKWGKNNTKAGTVIKHNNPKQGKISNVNDINFEHKLKALTHKHIVY